MYRKIPNISPGLEVRKHFFGGLYSGGLYSGGLVFGGHFVLVSEYQDLKIIVICRYRMQKRCFFRPKSPLFCIKIYLKPFEYLLIILLLTYIPVFERFKSCIRDAPFTLFSGGLYSGGLSFEGKFVLVIRGAYIRGAYIQGAYIRDFTVSLIFISSPDSWKRVRRIYCWILWFLFLLLNVWILFTAFYYFLTVFNLYVKYQVPF